MRSCIPQKHPPARIAVSVALLIVSILSRSGPPYRLPSTVSRLVAVSSPATRATPFARLSFPRRRRRRQGLSGWFSDRHRPGRSRHSLLPERPIAFPRRGAGGPRIYTQSMGEQYIFRVMVRGRFAEMSESHRTRLVEALDDHHVTRAAYTGEGTLTYDSRLDSFPASVTRSVLPPNIRKRRRLPSDCRRPNRFFTLSESATAT